MQTHQVTKAYGVRTKTHTLTFNIRTNRQSPSQKKSERYKRLSELNISFNYYNNICVVCVYKMIFSALHRFLRHILIVFACSMIHNVIRFPFSWYRREKRAKKKSLKLLLSESVLVIRTQRSGWGPSEVAATEIRSRINWKRKKQTSVSKLRNRVKSNHHFESFRAKSSMWVIEYSYDEI